MVEPMQEHQRLFSQDNEECVSQFRQFRHAEKESKKSGCALKQVLWLGVSAWKHLNLYIFLSGMSIVTLLL